MKVIVNILNVAKGRLDGEGGGDGMWSNFYALFKISYFKIIVKYDMRCLVEKELGVLEFFPTHSQPSQLSQLRRCQSDGIEILIPNYMVSKGS